MKKILFYICILLLLTGCGEQVIPVGSVPGTVPSPSPSVWGVSPSASPTAAPTPTSTPVPTPTPTPKPSFREVYAPGPGVMLQYGDSETRGTAPALETESMLIDGVTYVKASDLSAAYPWFVPTEDPTGGYTFSTASGGSTGTVMPSQIFDGVALENTAGCSILVTEAGSTTLWLPLRTVCDAVGLYLLWDGDYNTCYVSQILSTDSIPQGQAVPVLMYHEVGDETWGISELFVRPDDLRAQLQYMYDNGYDPIFFSDLCSLSSYDKPVLLTFDDGYEGNYTELFPLLKEFNMKATVFVVPELLDTPEYLTRAQVREMADSGLVSIQSHTMSHPELATLTEEEQDYQLAQSQLEITRITGRTPYVIAYPTGSYNDATLTLSDKYYSFGIKMNGGLWYTGGSRFTVDRYYISRYTDLSTFSVYLG